MAVHIRLDVDVVEFFRAAGPRYQSRISAALAELVRLTREGGPVTDSVNRVWAIADEASSNVDRAMRVATVDAPMRSRRARPREIDFVLGRGGVDGPVD